MPTFYTWDYEETPATVGKGGEQRCEAGDRIVVPELGDCTLDKVQSRPTALQDTVRREPTALRVGVRHEANGPENRC